MSMANKKRRITEDLLHRRVRASSFADPQRNLDAEFFNRGIGVLPRDQGILGGGPASQLRDRGILDGRPPAQLRDHGLASGWPTYQTRERGILEGQGGFRPAVQHLREQGGASARWVPSPFAEPGAIMQGWPVAQMREMEQQGFLGRAPSLAHGGWERLSLQASGLRSVDQDHFGKVGGSASGEAGILGVGPVPQLREREMGASSKATDKGLLGRWPSSSPVGFEGIPTFQSPVNGRFPYAEQYRSGGGGTELGYNLRGGNGRFADQEQYQNVGAPQATFEAAQHKRRYVNRKHHRSAVDVS